MLTTTRAWIDRRQNVSARRTARAERVRAGHRRAARLRQLSAGLAAHPAYGHPPLLGMLRILLDSAWSRSTRTLTRRVSAAWL